MDGQSRCAQLAMMRHVVRHLSSQTKGGSSPPIAQRIGIVGGLGLGAGLHYYRELAFAHHSQGRPLEVALVHAQLSTALGLVASRDPVGLAEYLAGVIGDLKAAGATVAVIPAVTPHFCIAELTAISPLPIVDMLEAIKDEVESQGLTKVAVFGTAAVQQSACYGRLDGTAEVVLPPPDAVNQIDDIYMQIATAVETTESEQRFQREALVAQASKLISHNGVQAILLAGTDLNTVFDSAKHTPFPYVDCAQVHIDAVMKHLQFVDLNTDAAFNEAC
eukprot:SAG31_NODE_12776_length_918_cov_0.694750_1_plen_276_part_00